MGVCKRLFPGVCLRVAQRPGIPGVKAWPPDKYNDECESWRRYGHRHASGPILKREQYEGMDPPRYHAFIFFTSGKRSSDLDYSRRTKPAPVPHKPGESQIPLRETECPLSYGHCAPDRNPNAKCRYFKPGALPGFPPDGAYTARQPLFSLGGCAFYYAHGIRLQDVGGDARRLQVSGDMR